MNLFIKFNVIRGINIFSLYNNFIFFNKIKKYLRYINNIKISVTYKTELKKNIFNNIKKICEKYNIWLTLNIIIKKKYSFINIYKFLKKIIKKIKYTKIIFSIDNIFLKKENSWYKFNKNIIYILNKKKIFKFIIINYLNNNYPTEIMLNKIKNIFNKKYYNLNIILCISIKNKKLRDLKKLIQFVNYLTNINIKVSLSEINYINNLQKLLDYCHKKNIHWWTLPKKKKYKLKNYISKNKKKWLNIIYCKNGIRQTSIKL